MRHKTIFILILSLVILSLALTACMPLGGTIYEHEFDVAEDYTQY